MGASRARGRTSGGPVGTVHGASICAGGDAGSTIEGLLNQGRQGLLYALLDGADGQHGGEGLIVVVSTAIATTGQLYSTLGALQYNVSKFSVPYFTATLKQLLLIARTQLAETARRLCSRMG